MNFQWCLRCEEAVGLNQASFGFLGASPGKINAVAGLGYKYEIVWLRCVFGRVFRCRVGPG